MSEGYANPIDLTASKEYNVGTTDIENTFAPRCLSIDLEVGKKDARIHQFAAVRGDTDAAFVYNNGDLMEALIKLDAFA